MMEGDDVKLVKKIFEWGNSSNMICRTMQAVSFQNKILYHWIIVKDERMRTLLLKWLCCKSEVYILAEDWLLKMKQILQGNPSRQLSMSTLRPLKVFFPSAVWGCYFVWRHYGNDLTATISIVRDQCFLFNQKHKSLLTVFVSKLWVLSGVCSSLLPEAL